MPPRDTRQFREIPELDRYAASHIPFTGITLANLRETGRNIQALLVFPDYALQELIKRPNELLTQTDLFWNSVAKNLLLACTHSPVLKYSVAEVQKAVQSALHTITKDQSHQYTQRAHAFLDIGKATLIHLLQATRNLPQYDAIASYILPILYNLTGSIVDLKGQRQTDLEVRVAYVLNHGAETILAEPTLTEEYIRTLLSLGLDSELGFASVHPDHSLAPYIMSEFRQLMGAVPAEGGRQGAHLYDAVMNSFGYSGINRMLHDAHINDRGFSRPQTTIAFDRRVVTGFRTIIDDTQRQLQTGAIEYNANVLDGRTYFLQYTDRYEGAVRYSGLFTRNFSRELSTEHIAFVRRAAEIRDSEQLEAYAMQALEAIFDQLSRLTDKADEQVDTDMAARLFTQLIELIESDGPLSDELSKKEKLQGAGKRSKRWEAIIKRAVRKFLQFDELSQETVLRPAEKDTAGQERRKRALSRAIRLKKLFGEFLSNANMSKTESQQEFAQIMLAALHEASLSTVLSASETLAFMDDVVRKTVVFATDRVPAKFFEQEGSRAFLADLLVHLYLLDFGAFYQFIDLFVHYGEIAKAETRSNIRYDNAATAFARAWDQTHQPSAASAAVIDQTAAAAEPIGPWTAIALQGAVFPYQEYHKRSQMRVTDEVRGLLQGVFDRKAIEWLVRMLNVMSIEGIGGQYGFKPFNIDPSILTRPDLLSAKPREKDLARVVDTPETAAMLGHELQGASTAMYDLLFADGGLIDSHHPMGVSIALLYGAATLRMEAGTDEQTKAPWRAQYIRKLVGQLVAYASHEGRPTSEERIALIAFETLLQEWSLPIQKALLAEITYQAAIHPQLYKIMPRVFVTLTRRAGESMHPVGQDLSREALTAIADAISGYGAAFPGGRLSDHSTVLDACAGSISAFDRMSVGQVEQAAERAFVLDLEDRTLDRTALLGLLKVATWLRSDLDEGEHEKVNLLLARAVQTDVHRAAVRIVRPGDIVGEINTSGVQEQVKRLRTGLQAQMAQVVAMVRDESKDLAMAAMPSVSIELRDKVESAYNQAKARVQEEVAKFGWDEFEAKLGDIEKAAIGSVDPNVFTTIRELGKVLKEQSPIGPEEAVAIKTAAASGDAHVDQAMGRIIEILKLNAASGIDKTGEIIRALVENNVAGVDFIIQLLKHSGLEQLTSEQISASVAVIRDVAEILNQRGEVRTNYSKAEAQLALNTISGLVATIEMQKQLAQMGRAPVEAALSEERAQMNWAIAERRRAIIAHHKGIAAASRQYRDSLRASAQQVAKVMEQIAQPYERQQAALSRALDQNEKLVLVMNQLNSMLLAAGYELTLHYPNVQDLIEEAQRAAIVKVV